MLVRESPRHTTHCIICAVQKAKDESFTLRKCICNMENTTIHCWAASEELSEGKFSFELSVTAHPEAIKANDTYSRDVMPRFNARLRDMMVRDRRKVCEAVGELKRTSYMNKVTPSAYRDVSTCNVTRGL